MMVWLLFIIGLMGLFFYNKIGSIIPMVVLPTTEIIEPKKGGISIGTNPLSKYCMSLILVLSFKMFPKVLNR